jgi:hypothetical protein
MPHIVLCDIIMPEKNGYEVCEFIKTSADLKHIPVLLLTGAFEPFDQERARSAGCDGFLAKPFEPQTLISKVKELLARAPAAAPAAPASPRAFPAAAPPPSRYAEPEERTAILPPPPSPVAPPPPARSSFVAATPVPPPPAPAPAPVPDYGGGFDDAFAIEAGERELMMEPGDHTVLLGGKDARTSAADDIWGEVESSAAASREEDSSTVYMAPPPVAAAPPPPTPPPPAATFGSPNKGEYEVQYEPDDLDSTWRMPGESATESVPAYQGFEEFVEPPPRAASTYVPPPPIPEPPSMATMEPPAAEPPRAAESPFEAYDPFVAAATQHSAVSPAGFEPAADYDTDQTVDSAVGATENSFDRLSTASFDAYGEPEIVAPAGAVLEEPEPEAVFETNAPQAQPFDMEELAAPSAPMDGGTAAPAASEAPSSSLSVDEALIEKLAARVVDKLSSKVLQEIAWEVVPDLAETMIRREIDALKAKMTKVPK